MSDALKPCPFCGLPPEIEDYGDGCFRIDHWCNNPIMDCFIAVGDETREKVKARWNRRADPVPAPSVTVKPLEWVKSHFIKWNGDWHTVPAGYTIRCADENVWKWTSPSGAVRYCRSPTAAKAAAQADYEARILAAIQVGPTPGWRDIETAPVGIPVLAYCYGDEVLLTKITKHGEDQYARMPDLWMPLPAPPSEGVET